MEIPVQKKPTHYFVTIVVFLIGVVVGGIIVSYVFFKVKDRLYVISQPPVISTALTAEQVQQAASITEDRTIAGKVTAVDTSSFSILIPVVNPIDSKNSTTTTVRIPFNQSTDEVIMPKPTATTVAQIKASFGDIKVGQLVLVKILNGKKTVFIPAS